MAYSSNDLIKYQQLYEQEKKRIEVQESASEAARIRRSYDTKVKAAKDAAKIEKLKNEEIIKLQKLSNDEYLDALKELANQEKEILKGLKVEVRQAYSDIADIADSSIKSVIDNRDALYEKLNSYGGIFTHHTVHGGGEDGEDLSFNLLKDFSAANRALEDYYKNIVAVKERIASEGFDSSVASDFLAIMADMSIPEGTTFTNLMLGADPGKFNEFIWGYLQNRELSASISAELYADDFQRAVDDTAAYMKSELERLGFEVPDDFSLSGTISAEAFGASFVAELDHQLEDIRNMIADFNADLSVSADAQTASAPAASPESGGVVYNQNFTVGTVKESVFDQITAWKNALLQARLRGQ